MLLLLVLPLGLFLFACDKPAEDEGGGSGIEIPEPGSGIDPDDDPDPESDPPAGPPEMPSSMFAQATRGEVDAIIARMRSGDADAAGMAMMSLPAHPGHFAEHPELIPVVIGALLEVAKGDGNITMRGMAIDKVVGFGEKAAPALPELLKLLEDEKTSVFTALYLHKIGAPAEPAIDRMIELLASESHDIQAHCAEGLGNFGAAAERSVPALAALLGSDSRDVVKLKAAHALGKIGPAAKAAIPALTAASESGASNLKYACTRALKKIQGN